jgi:hypothetical protein
MAKSKAKAKKGKKPKKGKKAASSKPMTTTQRKRLRSSTFAFKRQRKEPLNDAGHVRNAIARFDQVEGVSDAERDKAWKRIRAAAARFDVEVSETSWRQLTRGGKAQAR